LFSCGPHPVSRSIYHEDLGSIFAIKSLATVDLPIAGGPRSTMATFRADSSCGK
jgi:hypothetical protein